MLIFLESQLLGFPLPFLAAQNSFPLYLPKRLGQFLLREIDYQCLSCHLVFALVQIFLLYPGCLLFLCLLFSQQYPGAILLIGALFLLPLGLQAC
ncbi:MAG: hypothetical protein A2687_00770 [Candidatus Levybacteria bacterium RIFCSPHIGHO2_01_FULL_38_26]|nr:MAG: hypothetical protein A2687_00770 [Candidatus Levybacteria bacterium RIFCSPHIGHO2_01_FULL_38_26]